jgi:drug/metabolite transporter (DMT)-like permease
MNRHTEGVVLIVLSSIAYSSAGFFTRLVQLDAWTMLFWRGLFAGLMILAVIVIQERRQTLAAIRAVGLPGLAAAFASTAATIFYINALRHTSVADVAIIFAAAPFVTAGLGWLWLGEKAAIATLVASLFALLGVGIMMTGAATGGRLFGDLLAFGMTACMAVVLLIIRRHHEIGMLPATCLSAFLCPLLVWPLGSPFSVGIDDMMKLVLFGTVQFGLGLVLLAWGGRWISATENALISTIETPLAVAWVWACFNEAPSSAGMVGGVIVMAAVAAHVLHGSRVRVAAAVT